MPRNRRAAAPDVQSPSPEPSPDTQPPSENALSPAPDAAASGDVITPAPDTATPAPRRRRTPASKAAAEAAAAAAEAPEPPAAPKRRGGRRTKADAVPIETQAPEAPIAEVSVDVEAPTQADAPATEAAPAETAGTTPHRGRGRTRKPAADAASPALLAEAIVPTAEGVGVTPLAQAINTDALPASEASLPAPAALPPPVRGRRRRAGTAAAPPAPDAQMKEASSQPAPATEAALPPPDAVNADAGDTAAPAALTAPRRRGGRRRAGGAAEAVVPQPVETEAPIEGEANAAAAEPTDEEGAPRGRRRSRRRRRGGDIESADDVVEGSLLPEEDAPPAPDDDDLGLGAVLAVPTTARFVAPPLVPPVLAPAEGAALPRVAARIQHPEGGRGLPQIVVNDKAHAPFLFFVNTETAVSAEVVGEQLRAAASADIHLYASVMYLPFKNALGERSFAAIDALLLQMLDADPDGFLLPRLQCVPTNFWARTHPEQMARYADGSEGDVSMASAEFWADCVDALEALIVHLSDPATAGGDRVIGFHLDKGEWFYDREAGYDYSEPNVAAYRHWLHARYQQPYALRAAWFQGGATFEDVAVPQWTPPSSKPGTMPVYSSRRDQPWPDYAQYASDVVAEAIVGLSSAVKTLSEGRLLVGVSYGYSLEFAARNDSGHLALGTLLASPHIDILAGPNSYANRMAGGAASFGAPVDSVALHGKLWLVEDDTKTFLADAETDDTYNPKIAGGADTQAAHQRNFGAALAHGAGVTWMDLWGQGWLNSPEIWRELGILRDQANRLAKIAPPAPVSPDVVVFVDEASLAYLKSSDAGLGQTLVSKTRDLLLRTGASVGFYLQSDVLRANLPDAKLYLFLNALRVTTAERLAIREKLQRAGKTLAWVYAAGLFDERGLSEEEIGETVGMALRIQPWNSRMGTQLSEARHPLLERLRGGKRTVGQEEIVNPSYAVADPQAIVLGEYISTGAVSLAAREHPGGWKSVFFGDPHLSVEILRGLMTYAGVGLYDPQDDITYASGEGVLLVHATFTGQRTLALPRAAAVYDAMEDQIISAQSRTFRAFLRGRTSRLFLWGEADAVARATGLPLPGVEQGAAEALPGEQADRADEPLAEQPDMGAATPTALADSAAATLAAAKAMSSLVADMLADQPDELSAEGISSDTEIDYADPDTAGGALASEEALSSEDADDGIGDAGASAPRSRWQRRRAAMRARREAERQAQQSAPSGAAPINGNGAPANPAADMEALLPGLPPRRLPPPLRSEQEPSDDTSAE